MSSPMDRKRFCDAIEGGPGHLLKAAADRVADCTMPLPESTAALLGFHATATYAQGVALLRSRWNAGMAGH